MARRPASRPTRIPPLEGDEAELFAAARLRAARLQPYLATALFAMVPVRRPGYGTFGVDRYWRLYIDPDQAREWGVAYTAAVLLHEAHHLVRDHHGRADRVGVSDATALLWNLAGDAAINDDLAVDGIDLPDPVLPHHIGCRSQGLEESYYRTLRRRPARAEAEAESHCGSGSGGRARHDEIDDEPESREEGLDPLGAAEVQRGVAHDVTAAEGRGESVPPAMLRWAHSVLEPRVPWRTVLRAVLGRELRVTRSNGEPTWSRADRRSDSCPDVLRPGLRRTGPSVAVVIDTSASMERRLLDAAAAEIDALLHRAGVSPLPVVVCDQDAATPQRIRRLGSLTLTGGRGTDLRPGIAVAAAMRPTPRVIVALTDGLTPWPERSHVGTILIAVVIDDPHRTPTPSPEGPGIRTVRVTLDD